ncbi:glycosyltransferase family 4 protein [Bosea sp. 117]|uniref:glycosyltransferase family 4 protein n=1 Tax=Bosea sp. 117 TaxID=1125973 RepID=UPI0009DEA634|nr:glycosyltransferase family 4 protein [Bosea sp. 117]
MRFAYFGFPHVGGTHTVFRQLHAGLAPYGVTVRWLGMAPAALAAAEDPKWAADIALGRVVGHAGASPQAQAAALVHAVAAGGYDGVFVNVCADRVQMNIARYLPAHVLRIMIVHNITPGTYAAARAIRDHVHATVGVSERCRSDLVERHGFAAERMSVIPHAFEAGALPGERPARRGEGCRLLFLGRVEDTAKGVFWLPRILERLPASATLTVAGDGPDLPRLARQLARFPDRVRLAGMVAPDEVGELVRGHDLLLAPSRFEGFGLSMLEAMAGGCVPVASHIHGVTDTIVDDGVDGFLFPVGDWRRAAAHVEALMADPLLLSAASAAAMGKARRAFGLNAMAARYAGLIGALASAPPAIAAPLELGQWSMPPGMRDGWRTALPQPVKNALRLLRERLAGNGPAQGLPGGPRAIRRHFEAR